ncbi:aminoglycoside phosphotransferase family protein [Thiocapsa rosea]|uniref:Phosphotransferase family enzyme n=1 Tax=Thiocapsa rosea TaxID=69360 RepID=A0A495V9S0_9GAMM|nr:aminoglycoside phosphotransferase family protein [Thiocapsa rosea]RKT46151.1 phosphotransferase family enzyme [Thiocapsa rosea]
MLSDPDRALAARDTALPGLGLVLDREAILDAVCMAWPDDGITSLETSYLRYKPGTNCLVGYRARTPRGPLRFHAKAFADARDAVRQAGKAAKAGTGAGICLIEERRSLLRRFPLDRRLPALAALVDAEARGLLMSALAPEALELRRAELETLHYKPERRYVGKLSVDGGARAIVKLYDERDFPNAWRSAKAIRDFTASERLRVSRAIGRSKQQRVIVSRWIPGDPLNAWLHGPAHEPSPMRPVGAALAAFHRQAPGSLAPVMREQEAMAALAAADAVAGLQPRLAHLAQRLASRMASALLAAPGQHPCIHGDFSADQILLDADRVAIIDYDQAGSGDPAADLGSFIARLEDDCLAGRLASARAEEIAADLIEGYCREGRCARPVRTDLYVAAGLLRLAPEAFRRRECNWPERIEQTLLRVEHLLRGQTGRPSFEPHAPRRRRSTA